MQAGDPGAAGALGEAEGRRGEAYPPPAEAPGAEGGCRPPPSRQLELGWGTRVRRPGRLWGSGAEVPPSAPDWPKLPRQAGERWAVTPGAACVSTSLMVITVLSHVSTHWSEWVS